MWHQACGEGKIRPQACLRRLLLACLLHCNVNLAPRSCADGGTELCCTGLNSTDGTKLFENTLCSDNAVGFGCSIAGICPVPPHPENGRVLQGTDMGTYAKMWLNGTDENRETVGRAGAYCNQGYILREQNASIECRCNWTVTTHGLFGDPNAMTRFDRCIWNPWPPSVCQRYGCTDSTMENFDEEATVDDGSCTTRSLVPCALACDHGFCSIIFSMPVCMCNDGWTGNICGEKQGALADSSCGAGKFRRLLHPVVTTVATGGVHGYTTYNLTLQLGAGVKNIYAIYGDAENAMTFPPAYQTPSAAGTDIGGVNPLLWQVDSTAQYDSWLTVGITDGNLHRSISKIGIDFASWSDTNSLFIDDGAVFWMDPENGPSGSVLVAQITIHSNLVLAGQIGAQGQRLGTSTTNPLTWRQAQLAFSSSAAPEPFANCVPCTECPEGKLEAKHCTEDSDVTCTSCPAGRFLRADGNRCDTCTPCPAGHGEEIGRGTCGDAPDKDTVCTTCPSGRFSDGSLSSCRPCTDCASKGQSVDRPCLPSTDAKCGGKLCECQNHGVPRIIFGQPICSCPAGFVGAKCEQSSGCASNRCAHGGTCCDESPNSCPLPAEAETSAFYCHCEPPRVPTPSLAR